jgi:hypothetical protein
VQPLERIIPVARKLLTLSGDGEHPDLWLWERAERVSYLAQLVARMPELADQRADPLALAVAGLFSCAGWVAQMGPSRLSRWHLLARPTSDVQRELGAALLIEHAGPLLPPRTARLAAEAIRQCNDRTTPLVEAQALAEAENLDDVGALYVLRQYRQYQAEGRPLTQLIATWNRQQEYRYWEARLADSFRFETTRQLARQRLQAVDAFITALARDLAGLDLLEALRRLGADLPEPPRHFELPAAGGLVKPAPAPDPQVSPWKKTSPES